MTVFNISNILTYISTSQDQASQLHNNIMCTTILKITLRKLLINN